MVQLPPAMINGLETAWAMTIHKSQGSEFDHVLIVLPAAEENPLLTRELIYTAVTRAKKTVLLTAEDHVLDKAVKNTAQRISGIQARIKAQQ